MNTFPLKIENGETGASANKSENEENIIYTWTIKLKVRIEGKINML